MNLRPYQFRKTDMFLPCLYCGVDSGPVLSFFIWMIGAGLLAFFCFYGWGYINGKFQNDESAALIPLEVEGEDSKNVRKQ